MDILYTINQELERAVFAPRDRAEVNARIRAACRDSKTWGEFKKAMPAEEFADILNATEIAADSVLAADSFAAEHDVPGYADGDYPDWLEQYALEWFPSDLRDEYGEVARTAINGDYLHLSADRSEEVARALRDRGHHVARSDLEFI